MPNSEKVDAVLKRFTRKDPELYRELAAKAETPTEEGLTRSFRASRTVRGGRVPAIEAFGVAAVSPGRREIETIVRPNARPVLLIRDNKATTEFLGPESEVWAGRIDGAAGVLNAVIPAVGRVELGNHPDFPWVGTGWLVAEGIVVTNRHVARVFGSRAGTGFRFRTGPNGSMTARIDYLEEFERSTELEFDVTSILWIAPTFGPDVAFLRVAPRANRRPPTPIRLASSIAEDELIAAIGYPARDSRVPDQDLVLQIFGDVYDKKRLAPGQVMTVGDEEIEHDCSTLGGNSGSALVRLSTGEAVGLHFAGTFLQANFAVSALKIRELLDQVERGEGPFDASSATPLAPASGPTSGARPLSAPSGDGEQVHTFRINIPIEVTVRVGPVAGLPTGSTIASPAAAPSAGGSEAGALVTAQEALRGNPDVLEVHLGYRFKRGWITDERVVVVELREKLSVAELGRAGKQAIPASFRGIGVDVRTAALSTQLEALGIDLEALEAPPRPGRYREPPDLPLALVRERMTAIFHVSPDSGFPNLKAFLGRVNRTLAATIFEWESEHISDAIEAAIRPDGASLRMVTQKAGTVGAVDALKSRLGGKFSHVYASVGAGKLIPSSYHIKVASRDDEEIWLSSGNWKDSNQADIDPAGEDSNDISFLRKHNREWHAIIANKKLAKFFRQYIEWDFQEAQRVPVDELLEVTLPDVFIPIAALEEGLERAPRATYFDPHKVDNEVLEIQPLLTPDRDSRGNRVFIDAATRLVRKATRRAYIENQSFNLLREGNNTDEFLEFFQAVADRQRAGVDVRIIFRDPREFGRDGTAKLQRLLELLKDFGVDTDQIRVQRGCHTKGIIIDGEEVLLGSHNFTNQGALFNRDASLLVRDSGVAGYFEKIFLFDWETLARQEADELVGGVRVAPPGEETPMGFRRVSIAELLGES